MSWDFYKNNQVKARKEYSCDWVDHLDMCNLIKRDSETKKWSVNKAECADLGLTEDEVTELQAYCDTDFKIAVGELHNCTSGKFDGFMCSFRGKIAISAIMHKYDLYEED